MHIATRQRIVWITSGDWEL